MTIGIIAVGSNLGNRAANIRLALAALNTVPTTAVTTTSFLYDSVPWGTSERQPRFLNTVCQIETQLHHRDLLKHLKSIESSLGRDHAADRWSARTIDLDIISSGDALLAEPELVIPHALAHQRAFVLRPWADIQPDYIVPGRHATVSQLLCQLTPADLRSVCRVLPIGDSIFRLGTRTFIMGIVNVTPDSFSDGGQYFDPELAAQRAESLWKKGADIVDLGGQSTRPGAVPVSAEEELDRVIPVIERIRLLNPSILISVDTFHSMVAEQSIHAGAHLINDVSGGNADPEMLKTIAKLQVPYVCMHMRGNPATMTKLNQYVDMPVDIADSIEGACQSAMRYGAFRYNLVADPGIGFAKNAEQNLELLRKRPDWTWPSLIGPSRKRFLGLITGKHNAQERDWGTAAAVSASVAAGYDFVRVHNVSAAVDVCKISDAIWRGRSCSDGSVYSAFTEMPDSKEFRSASLKAV